MPLRRSVFLLAAAVGATALAFAGPLLPPAERPVYAVGDRWFRDDGVYELTSIEHDRYVFSAGPGREVRLTRDLALARVERGGIFFELEPPATIAWPLKVGAWGTSRSTRRAIGNPIGSPVIITWKVEDTDELTIAGRTLPAFRIRVTQRFTATGRETSLTTWYSPDTRRLLKAEGTEFETFKFAVTGFGEPGAALSAAPPPPTAAVPAPSTAEKAPAEKSTPPKIRIAEIRQVAGRVEQRRTGDAEWSSAKTGSRLNDADELRTAPGASAEIGLPDGSTLVLMESTHVAFTKLAYDAQSGSRNFLCFLLAGTVRADVVPPDRSAPGQPANFIISTHTGSATVSGAAVAVVAHEAAKQRSVVATVSSGRAPAPPAIIRYIDLAGTGVVTITSGMFITQVGIAPPSPPAPVAMLPAPLKNALSPNPAPTR